jgi:Nif-specific regulatory protein
MYLGPDMGARDESELVRVRRERDFYLRLLELGEANDPEPFLEQALGLVASATGARQAYIELRSEDAESDEPAWSMARGCSSEEVDLIRSVISRGIVAEALATGETVFTPSAMLDPRFRDRGSVRANRVEAVLCAPIGSSPALGVLYLQGSETGEIFDDSDCTLAEQFALRLAPLADRLLVRRRVQLRDDSTHALRGQLRLDGVIGSSPALAATLRQAALVAPLDVHVLLTGASGTGKSQLAKVIHDNGPRAAGPFVELNCAALPETLIESELFGAAAGAHSTAPRAIAGKVASANGGTLFLDEIAELAIPAQAKLLQLLQSKQYFPLGGTAPIQADIRLVAATNANLEEAVRERRFREDLFYRLQVLPIRLPALSERREDIAALSLFFAANSCRRNNLPRIEISRGALRAIEAAEWPGNLRQLDHAIEAATIRAAGEGVAQIELRHVFPDAAASAEVDDGPVSFQEATRRFQREILLKTLEETEWNVTETAKRLDLARSHVYNLINGFGLDRKDR